MSPPTLRLERAWEQTDLLKLARQRSSGVQRSSNGCFARPWLDCRSDREFVDSPENYGLKVRSAVCHGNGDEKPNIAHRRRTRCEKLWPGQRGNQSRRSSQAARRLERSATRGGNRRSIGLKRRSHRFPPAA